MKYTYEVMINTDFPHAECELVLDITGRFIFKSSTVFLCVCVSVCWGGVLLVCGAYLLLASCLFLSSYSPFLCSCLSISQDNQPFFLLKTRKHICVPV